MTNVRKASAKLTKQDAAVVKKLLIEGWFQNRIAALFDVNPGRISEIRTGKTFADVAPAS